jgi:glutamine---fructose-6-phosphate transaminase (isomerizing)
VSGTRGPEPGALFLSEIREQPGVLERVAGNLAGLDEAASQLRGRGIRLIRMAAHGSSDNAASYGVYAFALLAGLTAFRDSISLTVYFGAETDLGDSCLLGISQSGRTPDVIDFLARGSRRGALTLAVTNDLASPLAATADLAIPILAGEELAVAATKTYCGEVATLGLLAAHVAGNGESYAEGLRETAATLRDWLPEAERTLAPIARQLAGVERMLVVGRGPAFATAREIALKLLETCRIAAAPLTATDLAHGPVAALDELFPVWAVAGGDAGLPAVVEAVARVRAAGAKAIVSGPGAASVPDASISIPVPAPPLPLLEPLLTIVPGQLFAAALARAKGLDPDRPAGLAKVTIVP